MPEYKPYMKVASTDPLAILRQDQAKEKNGAKKTHTGITYEIKILSLIRSHYPESGLSDRVSISTTDHATVHTHQRIIVSVSAVVPAAPRVVQLTKATTKDAQSVTVDYKVAGGTPVGTLNFKVYRSKHNDVKPASAAVLIGTESVKATDLAPGAHQVTLLKGTDLPPDPAKPYVVVVATANGKTSQTYFRKWRLATVAHGYAGHFESDRAKTWAWVKRMQADLLSIDRFDKAIALNWIEDSWRPKPNMAVAAGQRLAQQIMDYKASRSKQHPGDVVDVHLIGHSRGTIVTSQALKALSGRPQDGSYVQVTLLDIHPASPASNALRDTGSAVGDMIEWKAVEDFQRKALDPQIELPAKTGIRSVEILWQNTPCSAFNISYKEHIVNLWGQSPVTGLLQNRSGVPINWTNLTSYGKGVQRDPLGHEEVHSYYQDAFVSKGRVK